MKVQSRPCVHRVIAHRGAVVAPSFRISKPLRSAACNASSEKQATEPETGGARKLEDGRMTYNPSTFDEMISDAAAAVCRGLDSGLTRMEVEFPVVSGTDCALFSTSAYKNASDTYIDSNTQLAIQAARSIYESSGKKVVILLPDGPEYERSSKLFKSALELSDGVSMSHLFEGREPLQKGLKFIFGMDDNSGPPETQTEADVHLVLNVSTNELPDVRSYADSVMKEGATLIFWNCELDTLRSDLGLFGFPAKSMQHDFLSTFRPVFYIRQRDYSKTVNVSPYIVNYSGALFRDFPGPWQIMLRQADGEYACIAEDSTRYTLYEVKEELLDAMGLNTEEDGSALQFLRRGYKTSTWWEDDEDVEKSDAWRT